MKNKKIKTVSYSLIILSGCVLASCDIYEETVYTGQTTRVCEGFYQTTYQRFLDEFEAKHRAAFSRIISNSSVGLFSDNPHSPRTTRDVACALAPQLLYYEPTQSCRIPPSNHLYNSETPSFPLAERQVGLEGYFKHGWVSGQEWWNKGLIDYVPVTYSALEYNVFFDANAQHYSEQVKLNNRIRENSNYCDHFLGIAVTSTRLACSNCSAVADAIVNVALTEMGVSLPPDQSGAGGSSGGSGGSSGSSHK